MGRAWRSWEKCAVNDIMSRQWLGMEERSLSTQTQTVHARLVRLVPGVQLQSPNRPEVVGYSSFGVEVERKASHWLGP